MIPGYPCSLCGIDGYPWDRINKRPICPDCQVSKSSLASTTKASANEPCDICGVKPIVTFETFPLNRDQPFTLRFCAKHLRGLLQRNLDPDSVRHLHRLLQSYGLDRRKVFVLCDEYYDDRFQVRMPIIACEEDRIVPIEMPYEEPLDLLDPDENHQ